MTISGNIRELALPVLALLVVVLFLLIRPSADLAPQPRGALLQSVLTHDKWLPGIDVSHYQGRISWSSVENSGVRFVYLKATEGVTSTDPLFSENLAALQQPDIKLAVGAYHFLEPQDDPIAQADHFLATAPLDEGWLPPVLDVEISREFPPAHIREVASRWLERVSEKTGCRPIIYTTRSFWEEYLGDDFAGYPLWIAEYRDELKLPAKVDSWQFWQHSQSGRIGGVPTSIDLSWFSGGEEQLDAITCKST